MDSDFALRELVTAIVAGNANEFSRLMAKSPELAKASFQSGATRQAAKEYIVAAVERYIYHGDTALHFAAAAYEVEMVKQLIAAGADVRAKNRMGDEPLHAAAMGNPNGERWHPEGQAKTIAVLIAAGADPNARDNVGATPLHKAVRTRCAEAVRVLLEHGANPSRKNRSGSDPLKLATLTTGRGGSGSAAAKAQQKQILELLESTRE